LDEYCERHFNVYGESLTSRFENWAEGPFAIPSYKTAFVLRAGHKKNYVGPYFIVEMSVRVTVLRYVE